MAQGRDDILIRVCPLSQHPQSRSRAGAGTEPRPVVRVKAWHAHAKTNEAVKAKQQLASVQDSTSSSSLLPLPPTSHPRFGDSSPVLLALALRGD